MASREVLVLYKLLLKEASGFSNYIYRSYARRRIIDAFHEHKNETDTQKIQNLMNFGRENLEIIKRQALISRLYKSPELVIEVDEKERKEAG